VCEIATVAAAYPSDPNFIFLVQFVKRKDGRRLRAFLTRYSDCQKNVPFAEGFFVTTAYAAILLIGTYL
jgi:hypothetical protein